MNRFQNYRFPYQYYNPYYRNNMYQKYNPYRPESVEPKPTIEEKVEESRSSKQKDDNFLFDLFGIKLYFDDVLILSLLFFLYKEEVKDEGLFLALVMLLIS